MTVNDLITAALRRLRVISGSDPPDGDSVNDALARFNDWVDALKLQDFLIFATNRVTWPIVPGQPSYLLGSGGSAPRPTSANAIGNIGYIRTDINPNYEYLLSPVLSEDAWAAIPQKDLTAQFPYYFYYNGTFPSGVLQPWPIPINPSLLGVIYLGQLIDEFGINDPILLPPGYRRLLRDGLAVELAPEFHVDDPAVLGPLRASADEAMRDIKRKNRQLRDLMPPAEFTFLDGNGRGRSNIYTGP